MPYKNKADKDAANRRWIRENPEKNTASRKASNARAKAKKPIKQKMPRVRSAKSLVEDRAKNRLAAISALGGACVRCGISDDRVLEFDHITPLRRRSSGVKSKSQESEIRKIARGQVVDGVQLLCANCHRIKTREGGEFNTRQPKQNMAAALDMLQRSLFDFGDTA